MEVDKHNFRQIILDSAGQLGSDMQFFNELCLTRRSFSKIIICGMGGSALAGDFFQYFKKKGLSALVPKTPIIVHRSYDLPPGADENSLIICSSYSGSTEETLSALRTAQAQGLEIAGLTCGGTLEEIFTERKIPWIKIPRNDLPPRMSLGFQLKGLVKLFLAYGLLDISAQAAIASLGSFDISKTENDCRAKSQALINKIPVVYASEENEILARLWKIKFNENSKIPAFANVFPELNHNEMIGWTKILGPFSVIILRDGTELPRIKKRMDLTAKLLVKSGLPVQFVDIQGSGPLEKLFWGMAYGDWLSYFLALAGGTDPYPVPMVEELKKELSE